MLVSHSPFWAAQVLCWFLRKSSSSSASMYYTNLSVTFCITTAMTFVLLTNYVFPVPPLFLLSHQGLRPVLSVAEDLHRPVDGPAVFGVGCHRCELSGVLHHSVHRGGLRRPHLPHFHLRGLGEALPPGRSLSLQCAQRSGQTHPGVVSNKMFTLLVSSSFHLHGRFFIVHCLFFSVHCSSLRICSCHCLSSPCGFVLVVSLFLLSSKSLQITSLHAVPFMSGLI